MGAAVRAVRVSSKPDPAPGEGHGAGAGPEAGARLQTRAGVSEDDRLPSQGCG